MCVFSIHHLDTWHSLSTQIQGMCGNNDGDINNEWTMASGISTAILSDFGDSYDNNCGQLSGFSQNNHPCTIRNNNEGVRLSDNIHLFKICTCLTEN